MGGEDKRDPFYGGKYKSVDPYRTLEEILLGAQGDAFSVVPTRMAQGGYVDELFKQPGTLKDLLRLLK
jgi:hypothetical protein